MLKNLTIICLILLSACSHAPTVETCIIGSDESYWVEVDTSGVPVGVHVNQEKLVEANRLVKMYHASCACYDKRKSADPYLRPIDECKNYISHNPDDYKAILNWASDRWKFWK